jgi:hypothetical protein
MKPDLLYLIKCKLYIDLVRPMMAEGQSRFFYHHCNDKNVIIPEAEKNSIFSPTEIAIVQASHDGYKTLKIVKVIDSTGNGDNSWIRGIPYEDSFKNFIQPSWYSPSNIIERNSSFEDAHKSNSKTTNDSTFHFDYNGIDPGTLVTLTFDKTEEISDPKRWSAAQFGVIVSQRGARYKVLVNGAVKEVGWSFIRPFDKILDSQPDSTEQAFNKTI